MENSYSQTDFAARLRYLQGKQDWTVQEMADLAGIPKRSLENYMRKSSPHVPSIEVLVRMPSGFGVPVEWLLFGAKQVAAYQSRLVRLCTRAAAEPFIKSFRVAAEQLRDNPVAADVVIYDGRLLGLTPEEWAVEIASEAGKRAEGLKASPTYTRSLEVAENILVKAAESENAQSEPLSDHLPRGQESVTE